MATTVHLYDPDEDVDHEVTAEAFDVTCGAGRSLELDEIGAGDCEVQARNLTGKFNPWYDDDDAAPYGLMRADRRLTVKDDGITVWTGFTEDFQYDWDHGRKAHVTIDANDGLAKLARQKLAEFDVAEQLSGARVAAILARPEVDYSWAASTDIDTGNARLARATVDAGRNVLNELQLVARSEHGRVFMSRANVLSSHDRYHATGSAVVDFNNDPEAEGIPFRALKVNLGSQQLYRMVTVTREGGLPQTVGTGADRHLTVDGLLYADDHQSMDLAGHLYDVFSTQVPLVSAIRVVLERLDSVNRAKVAVLDLGDLVDVHWTPPGGSAVELSLVVEGRRYRARHGAETVMEFQLATAAPTDVFELDSDELGELDDDVLGW